MRRARIALVAAGGHAIGLGHVMRSRRLADALTGAGANVSCFALDPEAAGLFGPPVGRARLKSADALVLDTPRRDRLDAAQAMRSAAPGVPLVLIGGQSQADSLGDLLIRQTLSHDDAGPRVLAGPDTLLLPAALFNDRPASAPGAVTALFCLGGGRRERYGEIAAALTRACPGVTWRLAGPPADETVAGLDEARVEAIAPDALHEAMLDADFAVISGGGLVHEAAAARLPAVYVPLASNQEDTVRAAAAAGLGRALASDATPEAIAAAAARLACDGPARASMHAAAVDRVRPGGPARCAEAVLKAAGLTAS